MKPFSHEEIEKNVIVIPELYANPLMKTNLMTSVVIPKTPSPSVHTTPSIKPAEIVIEVPEAPLLTEVESAEMPSVIAAPLD
jgi:hypothetical protein